MKLFSFKPQQVASYFSPLFWDYFLWIPGWLWTYYIKESDLVILIFLLPPPQSAGITWVHHHTREFFFCLSPWDRVSHYTQCRLVAQAGLKPLAIMPHLAQSWDYRCELLSLPLVLYRCSVFNPPSVVYLAKTFFHYAGCLLILLLSFAMRKVFNFILLH